MAIEDTVGRTYGPFPVAVTRPRAADLIASTSDDRGRWTEVAPPSFAAVPVFVAAPAFFADPDVEAHTGALIHADQGFDWAAPLRYGAELEVEGTVESVRARGPMNFVSFTLDIRGDAGTVLTASSTFVMSAAADPSDDAADEPEPWVDAKGAAEVPKRVDLPPPGEDLPPLAKSASRADLVRYAAATGDFNPIHWDHAAARVAGLPGVIAHGLLLGAWTMQAAAQAAAGDRPLTALRLRFRRYLRPAQQATVTARVAEVSDGAARLDVRVESAGRPLVTGQAEVALL